MPLNQNFYSFAIFISALNAVIISIQGVVYFLLGQQAYSLSVFIYWYAFSHTVFLLASAIFLRYFFFKTFYLAFWTILIVTIASLIQFSVGFGAFMGMRGVISYYMSAHIIVLAANMLFGLALIFSDVEKRYWLKLTGIYSLFISIVLLVAAVWYINSTEVQKLLTLEQIYKWASLVSWIGPVLLMMKFFKRAEAIVSEK
jgi:hypothetical protein